MIYDLLGTNCMMFDVVYEIHIHEKCFTLFFIVNRKKNSFAAIIFKNKINNMYYKNTNKIKKTSGKDSNFAHGLKSCTRQNCGIRY
jgi:L-rhamnose mutarotase